MENTASDLNTIDKFSRRQFLALGASSLALLPHGVSISASSQESGAFTNAARSLVLIHLSGGNDGFNTLVPYTSKEYYLLRPNIALRGDELIEIDRRFAFNSALHELAQFYREGVVALFPNVGCAESLTKSHTRATKIWQTASPDEQWKTNWHERLHTPFNSVSTVTIDGFDTHANQREQHFNSLRQLSITIENLRRQLNDTLVFVYSEFGRSRAENSMMGTDHGTNGLCIAIGAAVKGGIYTSDSASGTDFRSIYDSIASNWLQSSFDHSLEKASNLNFLTT